MLLGMTRLINQLLHCTYIIFGENYLPNENVIFLPRVEEILKFHENSIDCRSVIKIIDRKINPS